MVRRLAQVAVATAACAALAGCMPKMTVEEMKAQMPKRPAELDRLNAFVGAWEGKGEARMAMLDQPLTVTSTSDVKWEGDGWYLVERSSMRMADFDPITGIGTWTYDSKARKYRSTWVDSMGMIGMGESTYNEKSNTWKMKYTGYGPWGKSCMTGELRFPDKDTMEWTMSEYMGLTKTMEMTGSAKRKK